ncbi:fimbrial protein [Salmonella enterica subsp. enterica]|nr:fimbrial protein [Salmonella enterica subsp. enterica]
MSGQMTRLKIILVILAMMTGPAVLPVQAAGSDRCDVSSPALPFTNINIKSTGYNAGDTLKEFSFDIKYSCRTNFDNADQDGSKYHYPTLVTTPAFGAVIQSLKNSSLGLELTIQENGQPAYTLTWDEINRTGQGMIIRKQFGEHLPIKFQNETVVTDRAAILSGRIFAINAYQGAPVIVNTPALSSVLEIVPVNNNSPYIKGNGINSNAFFIRIFPDNLGQVFISPSQVSFGRIYATSNDTLTKISPPFTVTAKQITGTPVPFEVPLDIEFKTGGLPLTDSDHSIKLSTSGTVDENGLKLSIIDSENQKVTFNKTYPIGEIQFGQSASSYISKTYTAKVEPVPGAVIKTGTFSAAVTVVLTYN